MPTNRPNSEKYEFLSTQNIGTINQEERTVDIVFFTGAEVPRIDYWTGERYMLRFDPNGGDLANLNNGAPVLDGHSQWGTSSVLGVVQTAWKDSKDWRATLRFSKRADVEPKWQDIQDKILQKFSMGVEFIEMEKIFEDGKQVRLAKKWRPFEISIVPVPADFGTTTLSAELSTDSNTTMGTRPEGDNMPDNVPGTGAQTQTIDAEALRAETLKQERERVEGIEKLAGFAKLDSKVTATLKATAVKDGWTPEKFSAEILRKQGEVNDAEPPTRGPHVDLTRDGVETMRLGIQDALEARLGKTEPGEIGREWMGARLCDIARELLIARGVRVSRQPAEVAKLAMQNTADFADVLENSARKILLRQYGLVTPTYRTWAKKSTSPDFKTMSRSRLSEAPSFLPVGEGAGITIATMSDTKEQYALGTYGRGISFTRNMLINDDLGAFNDLIGQFGAQAARKENAVVYAILTANAAMVDTVALFHADHGNLGAGAIGNTGLDAMYAAMRTQKGIDGVSVLDIMPKYLIVPVAKEVTARMAMAQITGNVKAADQNHFAGRFEVVADPVLDASSTVIWYAAADPNIYPGVEYCHLEGAEGPQFIRKENEQGILGIQFYAFVDFAAKAVDFRPLYESSGQ